MRLGVGRNQLLVSFERQTRCDVEMFAWRKGSENETKLAASIDRRRLQIQPLTTFGSLSE